VGFVHQKPLFYIPLLLRLKFRGHFSGKGKATDFKCLPLHSQGPSEQKPIKSFEKKQHGRI